ncbi:hypothetical protein TraAM80_08389 [Trypanosoma rangeli]|uniref:Uncharacterized protein n=1 Tax=Trypanosoma rangeli TaxID=5698 RepID=A0A3R7K259_TRYRA|nr:uncharacterized protein TraAM80_08389 [Trypanosoma rangeli]RNE99249.1 hypothetical protein TraAM80_08389 [Trypanosoma rangeli]|eukprot:RNE99249.1 hypothetical protein TraAM80_08389 [Trypanosoma rangeli]
MRWVPLELGRVAEVGPQVDTAINTYTALQRQLAWRGTLNPAQLTLALMALRRSFAARLEDMTAFYQANDLDPRSGAVEAARLKLKRFLRTIDSCGATDEGDTGAFVLLDSPDRADPAAATIEATSKEAAEGIAAEEAREGTVTLRVVLTAEEYDELLARREAFRQLKLDSMLYKR